MKFGLKVVLVGFFSFFTQNKKKKKTQQNKANKPKQNKKQSICQELIVI